MTTTTAPTERFPLTWPAGWKRTPSHQRQVSKFGKRRTRENAAYSTLEDLTIGEALDRLTAELQRLGARAVLISSNLRTRLDGLPYSNQPAPDDPGVAVYFRLNKQDRCLACDRYRRVAGNIAAIAAHVEALRAIDRYGVGTLDQAFAGYTALPHSPAFDWRLEFGLSPQQPVTLEDVETIFRNLARVRHPDAGGTVDGMTRLTQARDAARKELTR